MPHRPQPLSFEPVTDPLVQTLMRDPAYFDRDHPDHPVVTAAVKNWFEAQGRMAEANGTAMKPFTTTGR